MINISDNSTWISGGNAICRNTFGNHAARADDTARTNGHTFEYDAMSANPNIVLYCNWRRLNVVLQFCFSETFGSIPAPHSVVHLMRVCVYNQDAGANVHVIANGQTVSYPHSCGTHSGIVPDSNSSL